MALKIIGNRRETDPAKVGVNTTNDPWISLRNGIIMQAVVDYRLAKKFINDSHWLLLGVSGKRKDTYMERLAQEKKTLWEVERFFTGEWFQLLTNIDGYALLCALQNEKGDENL